MAMRYSVTRLIEAPAERVWALLTDVGEQARWNKTLVSIEGQIVDGGTVTLISTVNPKRSFSLEVSDVSAPDHMTWSDGMPLGLFTATRTFDLKDQGGKTEFSMKEVYGGLLAGLITRSIPDMTDSFNEYAETLKAAAETSD
jgi:hypothetical protein